jgi:hypothetical protein
VTNTGRAEISRSTATAWVALANVGLATPTIGMANSVWACVPTPGRPACHAQGPSPMPQRVAGPQGSAARVTACASVRNLRGQTSAELDDLSRGQYRGAGMCRLRVHLCRLPPIPGRGNSSRFIDVQESVHRPSVSIPRLCSRVVDQVQFPGRR